MNPTPQFDIQHAAVVQRQVPIDPPVKTAFGTMHSRHLVALKIEDDAGHVGVGESWVNFPAWAPGERSAALQQVFIPYLLEHRRVTDIATYITDLFNPLRGPARQSGTIGPLLQAICAVEAALWDIAARRQGLPLCQLLFKEPHAAVQVYASGINNPLPFDLIREHLDQGVTIFKLKLGFGDELDRENMAAMKQYLGKDARLAVDVNRGWLFPQAVKWLPILVDYDVAWLEEPLAYEDERQLSELRWLSEVPIAGGENVMTLPGDAVGPLLKMPFDIWQPDVTKYTPLHIALALLEAGRAAGQPDIVPHFLGSGAGQALSLQLAAGCPRGLVELDLNRNPLRTEVMIEPFDIVDGHIAIPQQPGIGWGMR